MKWVDLRENLVRENVLKNNISIKHIPGKNNISDILTKEFKDTTHYMTARDSILQSLQDFRSCVLSSKPPKSYLDALTKPNSQA